MALSLAQKFINLGMPSPLAVEFASQLNTGAYNWKRLMWNSMVPELAKYVTESLNSGTFDPRIAMEKTMSEAVAALSTGGWFNVSTPSGFDWTPGFRVQRSGNQFRLDVSAETYRPEPGSIAWYSATGSDSNDGLTIDTPKRSVKAAINLGAGTVIKRDGGLFDFTRLNGMEGATLGDRDLTFTNYDGEPFAIARYEPPTSLTWTQSGTYSNVWSCTRSTAGQVSDFLHLDEHGEAPFLTAQTSEAAVAGAPGSRWINGSTVYVSLIDGRQPDANVLIFMTGNPLQWNKPGRTLFIDEGVEFWGGTNAVSSSSLTLGTGTRIIGNGASFKYAVAGNCLASVRCDETYLFGCVASKATLDGLNYHYTGETDPGYFLELDCVARDVGGDGGSNNPSTAHETARGIRVGGTYGGGDGPQIADINTSKTWNLGISVTGPGVNIRTLDTAEAWFDTCISSGATTDLDAGTGSTIRTRDLTSGGVNTGAGTITTY